mmetsp:Transcript_2706/g.8214  ORF Transcript_2706/g.8214 Transcript_2706/m.8214 type:complete len:204 (+) Transcript_2706:1988-2599(+)
MPMKSAKRTSLVQMATTMTMRGERSVTPPGTSHTECVSVVASVKSSLNDTSTVTSCQPRSGITRSATVTSLTMPSPSVNRSVDVTLRTSEFHVTRVCKAVLSTKLSVCANVGWYTRENVTSWTATGRFSSNAIAGAAAALRRATKLVKTASKATGLHQAAMFSAICWILASCGSICQSQGLFWLAAIAALNTGNENPHETPTE